MRKWPRFPYLLIIDNPGYTSLPYLDFLFEDMVKAVVINGGATLVNIPAPAQFALHKLIVTRIRSVAEQAKKDKDLFQAYQVLLFLKEERPGDIALALESIKARGPAWEKRIRLGMEGLKARFGWLD